MIRDKNGISKITLGSAQLGLNYGINSVGQPTEDEVFEILRYTSSNGVDAIDTSPIYGSSEKQIGKFIKGVNVQKIFVVTRLEAQEFPEEIWEDRQALFERVERELRQSCMNLGLMQIPAYILHFADQAFRDDGTVLDILVELKKQRFVKFIGTSLYTSDELERCIDDTRIDVVQVPFSILDRRLLESGFLNKAYRRGLVIFARSVFLQGLVFMDRLPIELRNAKETLSGLHHLADSYGLSVNELCLRYVLSVNEISSIVVGVDNLKHVKENIRIASSGLLNKSILKEIERLPQMPPKLIDIRSWGRNYDFTREAK